MIGRKKWRNREISVKTASKEEITGDRIKNEIMEISKEASNVTDSDEASSWLKKGHP